MIDVDPKKPNEALKTWLRRYGDVRRDLEHLYDRIDALRSRAGAARTSKLDGMPNASGFNSDRTGAILAQIEELEVEATALQGQAEGIRHEITAAVKQINGPRYPDQRAVVLYRYIDLLRWEDISEHIFGDLQRFWDRQDTYLRRTHRLHTEALAALAEILYPDGEGQENNPLEENKK